MLSRLKAVAQLIFEARFYCWPPVLSRRYIPCIVSVRLVFQKNLFGSMFWTQHFSLESFNSSFDYGYSGCETRKAQLPIIPTTFIGKRTVKPLAAPEKYRKSNTKTNTFQACKYTCVVIFIKKHVSWIVLIEILLQSMLSSMYNN